MFDHSLGAEAISTQGSAAFTHGLSLSRVINQPLYTLRQLPCIAGQDEQSCLTRTTDFACSVHIIRNDRNATEQGLRDRSRQALAIAWMRKRIHRLQIPGDFIRWHQSGQKNSSAESERCDSLFQASTPPPITNPQQTHVRP